MISALDTNILLDLLVPQAPHQQAAKLLLDTAHSQGALIICEGVYAELGSQFDSPRELDSFLRETGIQLEPSTRVTLQQTRGSVAPVYQATRFLSHLCRVW